MSWWSCGWQRFVYNFWAQPEPFRFASKLDFSAEALVAHPCLRHPWSDISLVFRKLSANSSKYFRQLHGGYTIKLLLINCSFHTENVRTLVFVRNSFHSVRTSKRRSEYFAVWTSQLVNKSIELTIRSLNKSIQGVPICIQQLITQKMADQEWSDFHVVFTMILCSCNFSYMISYEASISKSHPNDLTQPLYLIRNQYDIKWQSYYCSL